MAWGFDAFNLTRVCPICGKKFIPEVEHVYRDKSNPNRPPVCTYSCMRESERRQEEKRTKTVRRYKRLNLDEMTKKQRQKWMSRNGAKCSSCDYAQRKTSGEETMVFCEHPDREYIYQNKVAHRGRNLTGMIAVIGKDETDPQLKTPKWCPLRKEYET